MRKKIILYNPKAVFFDMPLALLAIGSNLDKEKYEVIIIDARVDVHAEENVLKHITDALCFGVTVLTGSPLNDALNISQKVKHANPKIPVIWGGWHTSLFPEEPIQEESFVDITVQGQGEETFAEIVMHLDKQLPLDTIKGICFRVGDGVVKTSSRPVKDMNDFPRINYDLIDVEKYFQLKGKRQFDYISSIGCYFRCAFCADPFVYQRKYAAYEAQRMVDDIQYYYHKYQFTDLNFQDETFFTYPKRIAAFSGLLVEKNIKISWAATMRADQGYRMTHEEWKLCKDSGLRRVLIGVESGSQEMMDWLKKDIKLDHVFECARKCKELGIDVIFPFIVGFPDESEKSVSDTVNVIKLLKSMSPGFRTEIFYFKPYPGSSITESVTQKGYQLPSSTRDWANFDYIGSSGPWVSEKKYRFFESFKFYLKLAWGSHKSYLFILSYIAQWRCRKNYFKYPIEKIVFDRFYPKQKLS